MSAFDPPFATNGELRAPTANEKSLGFPCGPVSQALFNFLINRLEGNIDNIADQAGVTAAAEDDATVLFRAVDALIAAAIGSGDTSNFVLFTQARARLPIFPEVQNTAGTIVVTAPSTGTVRVPAGTNFLHRGIFLITTAQTDFPTDPSKTYHLRWNPTDGFVLRDLASGVYNPSTLAEGNAAFDSSFDDMLVARIVTNSSNVATITNLSNKNILRNLLLIDEAFTRTTAAGTGGIWVAPFTPTPLNWARTPAFTGSASRTGLGGAVGTVPEEPAVRITGSHSDSSGSATASINRYGLSPVVVIDMNTSTATSLSMTIQLSATLIA
jgi:hypothetical protein